MEPIPIMILIALKYGSSFIWLIVSFNSISIGIWLNIKRVNSFMEVYMSDFYKVLESMSFCCLMAAACRIGWDFRGSWSYIRKFVLWLDNRLSQIRK